MRTCVECDGRTLSYGELIALVDARARELAPLVRDGDVVAIRREKSERYVVDLLAVLSLGAPKESLALPADPKLRQLYQERRALEQKAEALKLLKASMPAEQYAAELEKVLIELARKTQEIRAIEGKKQ